MVCLLSICMGMIMFKSMFGFKSAAEDAAMTANVQYRGQQQANSNKDKQFETYFYKDTQQWGTIVVQTWPEGLVIYVGGEIVYRSWKK